MPSFFTFQQGSDSRSLPPPETESLRYGRFRALPARRQSVGNLFSAFDGESSRPLLTPGGQRGTYGAIGVTPERSGDGDEGDGEDDRWWLDRVLLSPRRKTVVWMVERWWRRLGVLVLLPAAIVVLWCAIPFPKYPLERDSAAAILTQARTEIGYDGDSVLGRVWWAVKSVFDPSVVRDMVKSFILYLKHYVPGLPPPGKETGSGPGHGEATVRISFWFFLTVYYAFYNLIALLWITKLFNLYSMNWWPSRLGFPPAFTLFNLLPLLVSVPMYYLLPAAVTNSNLTWILLTFTTMSSPVLIAFLVLLFERRSELRRNLTATQLLFSSPRTPNSSWRRRQRWGLARSFIRFLWFCSALLLSLVAFVLGEAYAELYLRTLPHNSLETVIYVWSWIATIHLLDGISGWILGAKVGSYPLSWVFKLFFATTYQTYVRALYARLRSPSQFAYLQLLSSSIVVIYNPLSMTRAFHDAYRFLGLSAQPYEAYKKYLGRSFFLRGLAENVSMLAWLGCNLIASPTNKILYPYLFASGKLTLYASLATWACEILAGWIVRRVMWRLFEFAVTEEAMVDLRDFPELVPAAGLVMVHVLQNMLVGVVRLRF